MLYKGNYVNVKDKDILDYLDYKEGLCDSTDLMSVFDSVEDYDNYMSDYLYEME